MSYSPINEHWMSSEQHELIVRSLSGEASSSESQRLQDWLSESPENQAIYEQMKHLWQKSTQVEPGAIPDVDSSWHELRAQIGHKTVAQTASILPFGRRPAKQRPVALGIIAAAASLVLIFALHGLMREGWQSIATANGETRKVQLPDGSLVTLNHASRIEYPKDFTALGRQVRLNGEAYFEVVKDTTTFSVATENAVVQVLGTKFNVWGRNQETRVIVSEGRVALQNSQAETILKAGESSHSFGNQPPSKIQKVDADVYLGWMQGKLVFSRSSLREIADELQRKYDVRIDLLTLGIDTLTVTGSFQKQPLETVLRSICLTLDLQYAESNGVYRILKNRED